MSDLTRFLENLDPNLWPWADILILVGLAGGIVFAVWIVVGAIQDLTKLALTRPNKKLGRHIAPAESSLDILAAATVIGGSLGAILWVIFQ